MSFADPEADVVQPDAGQGDGGAGDPPYADYLNRIPEEVRGDVEPIFKEWDANTTRRFQDHSQYKETWEPYGQAGINQYSPQDIQAAFQLLNDPQEARTWLDQQYGPVQAAQPEPQPADPFTGFEDPTQQQLEQLLEAKLGPVTQQLEAITTWRQEQEQQRHEAEVGQQINHAIEELKAKEADKLPEELRGQFDELIERFGMKYAEPGVDPKTVVARAWTDLSGYVNAIEKAVLQSKVDAPKPAEGGGVPDVTPETAATIKAAGAQALEAWKAANRQ